MTIPFVADSQISLVGTTIDGKISPQTQIGIDSSNPINFRTLYVEAHNPGVESATLQVDIYVCGDEIISSATGTQLSVPINIEVDTGI
jgi:hypothetical protein